MDIHSLNPTSDTRELEALKRPDTQREVTDAIGRRIYARRRLLGISQQELGKRMGISFQQVQKYEKGANRVSAARLYHLSRILQVSPLWFFEDLEQPQEVDTRSTRVSLSIARHLQSIDPDSARAILNIVRAVAESQQKNGEAA